MPYINDLSPETELFLQSFDRLSHSERLTFLGLLFDRIDNGMVNSENKANGFEVSDDGYILTPDELGIDACGDLAFALIHEANDCLGGSFPQGSLIDCLDTWATRTIQIDKAESRFLKLTFLDKLYALAELFCQIGGGDIAIELDEFDLDGYFAVHCLLNLIAKLFPSENKPVCLPF